MSKALISMLLLGGLVLLAACGADGPPAAESGIDLAEFWRR